MKSAVIVSVVAAAIANANPILTRGQMCDVAPTATVANPPAPLSSPGATTASGCQQQCEANGSCQSFVFGLPPSATAPKCILFAVPASQVPSQGTNLNIFDKACSANTVPTQAPTAANPQGPANGKGAGSDATNGHGAANGSGTTKGSGAAKGASAGPSNQNTTGKRADTCGAAPSGPSNNRPSPFRAETNVVSQQACLALCQQTKGCQSCEFGIPSANSPKECLLFSVPAAQLPPPTKGQTFVAFDIGC
ncbi:uncharacterized protein TRIVIDRAFT_222348 [Trichoderma virens Gv29-8]|uniref:Apple domain-containing protein n=1 Tax=Hypocrea virens (strain Gv29-8 / FGSC 10586) TaxID=413071 RepID=G9MT46_HYPVG|nr:uncharacterized protein TRIVIDRAFT_222348 [Trichoderma virens Gv29-8]EHK23088.1 hypothetical protein TRIVIDRAFT_222348 [Trichoderma virens Gv29-8]UKZ48148.1 hypothetical protein TrVGV298_002384 [Trichoderma virens]